MRIVATCDSDSVPGSGAPDANVNCAVVLYWVANRSRTCATPNEPAATSGPAVSRAAIALSSPLPLSATSSRSAPSASSQARTATLPPATVGSSPWRMLFSTSGCSSSVGIGTAASSGGRSSTNRSRGPMRIAISSR